MRLSVIEIKKIECLYHNLKAFNENKVLTIIHIYLF